MAKKRKNKKSSRRRKYAMRGIGALAKGGAIMDTLTVGGSAVGLTFVNNMISQNLPNVDERYISGGKILLGHFLPGFTKNPKTKKMLQLVGYALISTGAIELAQQMGVIKMSGIGNVEDDDELAVALSMNGDEYDEYEEINGNDDLSVVNDDILNDDILNDDLNVVQGF